MTVAITIDLAAAAPAYEQIRTQVAGHIRAGRLEAGDKLPVVRALAADLGIATNTVARAYRELEVEGLVTRRRRVGTIVQDSAVPAPAAVQQLAKDLVAEARGVGLGDEQVVDIVRGALLA